MDQTTFKISQKTLSTGMIVTSLVSDQLRSTQIDTIFDPSNKISKECFILSETVDGSKNFVGVFRLLRLCLPGVLIWLLWGSS